MKFMKHYLLIAIAAIIFETMYTFFLWSFKPILGNTFIVVPAGLLTIGFFALGVHVVSKRGWWKYIA